MCENKFIASLIFHSFFLLYFRITSDHNKDRSIDILKLWVRSVKDSYHSIFTELVDIDTNYPQEIGPGHWTDERFNNIINLRETSLNNARKMWADYYLVRCVDFLRLVE